MSNYANIDKNAFEAMCMMQSTRREIALVLGCNEKTLDRWCKRTYGCNYKDIHIQKKEAGKMSLRRKQWKWADKSPAMAIFLGKNYLGQSDSPEVKNENTVVVIKDDMTLPEK